MEVFMVQEFYAVTTTSVYHVQARDDNSPYPSATKIALKGPSRISVGGKLNGGRVIAITKRLVSYTPESGSAGTLPRTIEHINVHCWRMQSSSIVALFKTKEEALRCFEHNNCDAPDLRWAKETAEVLKEIGDDHPAFEICRSPGHCLLGTP